ncbi:unnamed protein product [Caenorhabditis angaria]|uniref:Membrane-bound transcription factor site-2 protease n=1 Tax=Caenorhabditis angaria TaxID=860376 RepID=A0A9P1IG98_9PELO|nr:unnamed protein product [Caenorhabditis angaria]
MRKKDDEVHEVMFDLEQSRFSKLRILFAKIWFALGALVSICALITITFYMTQILLRDVSHWMSTRPKIANFRNNVEYRSMQNVLMMTSPIPTTTINNNDEQKEIDEVIVSDPNLDYDMIENGQQIEGGIVPVIPGYNLPWTHIPVFMATLIVVAIIHELGHAWAARSNNVQVNGFGIFVMGIFPGAFTEIERVSLKRASKFPRLQIYGAGIWHNLLLALFAVALFHSAPSIMSPILVEGRGVSVKRVDSRSGLAGGTTGLHIGDVVRKIDECSVETIHDWIRCLKTAKVQHNGRCVDKQAVEAATAYNTWTSSDEIHCCDEFNVTNAHVCFEREEEKENEEKSLETNAPQLNSLLGIGNGAGNNIKKEKKDEQQNEEGEKKYSCLNARHVVEQAVCNISTACEKIEGENEKICVYPALFNGTRLVKIGLANRSNPILFVGHLNEMLEMVSISSHTARFGFADILWLDHFQLLAKYLFTLSLALGGINAMPCYYLDGQHIVATLLKFTNISIRRRNLILYLILLYGTSILVLNIFVGFVKLIISRS